MKTLIVMFDLKPGQSVEEYEQFAKTIDVPGVKRMNSVDEFRVYKSESLLFSEDAPPCQYFEVIEINDMDEFGNEVQANSAQEVATKFQSMVDNLKFILTDQTA